MSLIERRLIMAGIFPTILYTIFIYFLIGAIANLFDGISFIYQISIALFIGAITLIPIAIELKKSNFITRSLMAVTEIIKWMFLMYLFLTIAIYLIQIFINIPSDILMISFVTIIPILAIYAYIKAHRIVIKPVDLKIDNLDDDVKLIHISDIHIGSIRNKKLLQDIVKKINSTEADLVVISGDLADGTCPIGDESFLPFKDSKVPIIFTPGNHDLYPGIENVINAAKTANIKVLSNEVIDFKGLQIIGLPFSFEESTTYGSNNDTLDFHNIEVEKPTVLINHLPVNWDNYLKLGIDLQLSGHTHGGQFYPVKWFIRLVFPFSLGVFEKDGKYLSVTAGIGTFGPPMRWGTDAEMILLNLKNK